MLQKEEIITYLAWRFLKATGQNILTSLLHPTKETVKATAYTVISIYLVTNIVEGMTASKRQKLDATSEWGRYADKPAARGQALSLLMMQLTPYVILPSLLDKFSKKKKDDLSEEEYKSTRAHKLRHRGGEMFADGLLKLGPLYVKIGQILSCRENLFPDEWITAMGRLQDRVPAKSGKEAWDLLYDAAPGGKAGFHKLFRDFDDVPLAAASLGQVHRATLRSSGERVAIKLQRSRMRDIYDKDLALMKKIAKIVDKFGKAGQVGGIEQSWVSIFNDAESIMYREIDYRDEADNAIRFANDFGIGLGGVEIESTAKGVDGNVLPSAAEWLRTPYTYGDLSSEKFLVMEYVPSIKANNNEALNTAGVTREDREYLAECLARAYLRQFCAHKFFSTDPHAGMSSWHINCYIYHILMLIGS
jgi:predicted unusual protein kinase regulating ubiquinone biosynthesis (AarF/ABC1/UbiB family)